jgi:hypothetical protein
MTRTFIITSKATHLPDTPPPAGWTGNPDAWHVVLTIEEHDGKLLATRTMAVPFFTGEGHRFNDRPVAPTTGDVLECLATDAASFENAADFADWAEEFGMLDGTAEGLRAARKTWHAVETQTESVKTFLGDAFEKVLYEAPDDGWASVTARPVGHRNRAPANENTIKIAE